MPSIGTVTLSPSPAFRSRGRSYVRLAIDDLSIDQGLLEKIPGLSRLSKRNKLVTAAMDGLYDAGVDGSVDIAVALQCRPRVVDAALNAD